jgi:hypothetical protein
MANSFAFAVSMRERLGSLIRTLSIEQLNKIPEGLNNNIAWHLGHIVVSSEILCYHKTGTLPEKEIKLADKYRNGTKPESFIEQEEIDYLLSRLMVSLHEIEVDRANGLFPKIVPYSTHTFGFGLKDMDDVIACCSHHDLLHCGNMMTMRKLIQ